MKIAVIQLPGSNCDQDALYSLKNDLGLDAEYVWHDQHDLTGFDAVFVPGGFTYGDYLRCGAIAARSPIMESVKDFAGKGGLVIGVCNGFQILCELGLLPGALLLNEKQKFICQDVFLKAENHTSPWTKAANGILRIPIAHGEGRFVVDEATLRDLEANHQIAFRYVDASGNRDEASNVNGSTASIAGVLNEAGNVLGLMPHPERATNQAFGYADGLKILAAFQELARSKRTLAGAQSA